jgi:hypothetical protein
MGEIIIDEQEINLALGVVSKVSYFFNQGIIRGCDVVIADECFPTVAFADKFKLLTITDYFFSEIILNFLKEKELKPAEFSHLLAFAKFFPDKGNKPIIALGTKIDVSAVPGLWHGCSLKDRSLILFRFKSKWSPGTQFLAKI